MFPVFPRSGCISYCLVCVFMSCGFLFYISERCCELDEINLQQFKVVLRKQMIFKRFAVRLDFWLGSSLVWKFFRNEKYIFLSIIFRFFHSQPILSHSQSCKIVKVWGDYCVFCCSFVHLFLHSLAMAWHLFDSPLSAKAKLTIDTLMFILWGDFSSLVSSHLPYASQQNFEISSINSVSVFVLLDFSFRRLWLIQKWQSNDDDCANAILIVKLIRMSWESFTRWD